MTLIISPAQLVMAKRSILHTGQLSPHLGLLLLPSTCTYTYTCVHNYYTCMWMYMYIVQDCTYIYVLTHQDHFLVCLLDGLLFLSREVAQLHLQLHHHTPAVGHALNLHGHQYHCSYMYLPLLWRDQYHPLSLPSSLPLPRPPPLFIPSPHSSLNLPGPC